MDADKCQEDFNTMSEQLQSSMEKVVSEATEPEKSPLAVEEPKLAAVNGRHEEEPSPVDDQQTNEFPVQVPESAAQSEDAPMTKPEEALLEETAEQDMPPDVSEKVEEPAGVEEMVPPQPQADGSPEKVSDAPEQEDVRRDALEKVGEPVEVEGPSEATQLPPEASPEPLSPSDATPAESERLHMEQQPAVDNPEPKVVEHLPSPQLDSVVPLVEEAVHKEEAPAVEVAMATVEVVSAIEPPKEKAVEEVLGKAQDIQMESPIESKVVREVCSEAPAQAEGEAVKEEEAKTPAGPAAGPDLTAVATMDQVEQKEATIDQMEPTQEAAPAPGSLAFTILEDEQTKAALQTSRTLVVLRGLPGSGKTFLASAIAHSYQNICSVVHYDDEALIACCSATSGPSVVVVDDQNHTHDRLARLTEVAEEYHLVALFLEPGTEWCRDVPQLVARSACGLEEAQVQAMKGLHEEVDIPLFFGWFLLQDKIKCTAADFLKTLDSLEAFKKHLADFPVETEKEVDLEQYFHSNWQLHCTTKFCDYGKAKGAKEYAEETAVKTMYGSVTELSLTALFVTPRTFGAQVSLSEAQLALWPADGQEEAESSVAGAMALPPGSRAHISLGCAEKVKPVQTGLDLLDILVLQQQAGQQGEPIEEMELGSLAYLEKGRWLLTLREPVSVLACFSSKYEAKEVDATKKDPERKRKIKCSIL